MKDSEKNIYFYFSDNNIELQMQSSLQIRSL